MLIEINEVEPKGKAGRSKGAASVTSRRFLCKVSDTPIGTDIADAVLDSVNLPQIDEVHPADNNKFAVGLTGELVPDTSDIVEVIVTYSTPTFGTGGAQNEQGKPLCFRVGTTLQSDTVSVDANNQLMKLTYTATAANKNYPVGWHDTVNVTCTKSTPVTTLECRRTVITNPLEDSLTYVGMVNTTTWYKKDPRTWLCTGITGDTPDGGWSWQRTDTFAYKHDGWDQTKAWRDPKTGEIPPDVTSDNGMATFQIYLDREFTEIGIGGGSGE